jgi:16S rRNA (cytosine967-C5)-methyltransferase
MIAPARVAAYHVLTAVAEGRADLATALAHARGTLPDDRDRALTAEIVTGVQRWRGALDFLIVHFAKRPIERMDAEVVETLRLSAYQLLHLTRIPAAAVVDDAVELARRVGKSSASGFVNAVLRSIARCRNRLPLPPRPSSVANRSAAVEYLTVTLSHPVWLVERWLDRFGFETAEQWLRFNNGPAPLTLRANPIRTTPARLIERLQEDGIRATPGRFAPDALIIDHGDQKGHRDHHDPLPGELLSEGWCVIQDEASQLVPLLAGPHPQGCLLDTCASPGGKTTALAAAMTGRGLVVACDVRPRRVDLLRRTVAASGATNIRLVQADLTKPLPFSRTFDCVLVDAPCSGLGALRRDPDIRWRRRESDLPSLAATELVMIQHAGAVVAPGGRLVYSTCSSEPEENEWIAAAFLQTTTEFTPVDLRTADVALPAAVIDNRGHFRTHPHVHGLEAFFGAVFARSVR